MNAYSQKNPDVQIRLSRVQDAQVQSPREERRRVRLETTRSQVLDAAERIFASAGFHNTTIKSIAAQCEIAVGTMYTLFDDKKSLFEAVLRRRGGTLRSLTEAKAAEPGPCDIKLVELADVQISFFREHPDWTRVATMLVKGYRGESPDTTVPGLYESGHKVVADLHAEVIARGQREGTVRGGNPLALALIFMSMLETFHGLDDSAATAYEAEQFLDLVHSMFRSTDRQRITH
jgi:AcrR family transcriptional regulator